MVNKQFWNGKRVFITGHTGFKGSWLSLWLVSMGAKVTGFALEPPTNPSLYNLIDIEEDIHSIIGDIRHKEILEKKIIQANPEIIIHMAAQPLVRDSYLFPIETYETNVMGTVYLFEAIRKCSNVRAVVNVTTDKCYENKEWVWGYREIEPLGGEDPYSNSKACSELVTSAYRQSFFHSDHYEKHRVAIASARAGNVIGGGDWAKDRLIPDAIRALENGEQIIIRNPNAIRPWQHVLVPLSGYLLLAEKLYDEGPKYIGAWNFGPANEDSKSVEWIVKRLCKQWSGSAEYKIESQENQPHEAMYLKLDSSKAKSQLKWKSKWNIEDAIDKTIEWYKLYSRDYNTKFVTLRHINEYMGISEDLI